MATAGIVEYEPGRGAFRLPPEHAAMMTRAAGPNNFACFAQMVPMCAGVEDELVEKFREGGGVPYSSYPRFHEVMAETSGAIFDTGLVQMTLPLVPGIVERLDAGADVADVCTGSGHAVNVMAKAFPNSMFVGYDFHPGSIDHAQALCRALHGRSRSKRHASARDPASRVGHSPTGRPRTQKAACAAQRSAHGISASAAAPRSTPHASQRP